MAKAPRRRWRTFKQARVYVRKLKLKSFGEWEAWRKTKHRPANIPSAPDKIYRDSGWVSYPDFLGYMYKGNRVGVKKNFLPFKQARVFARKLKLKSARDWEAWRKTKYRPANIPSNPHTVYRDSGWVSYPDFLGYKKRTPVDWSKKDFLPFKQARVFVRKLKLKSHKEWEAWAKTKHRPANIPSNPHQVYRDSGWISWPDFLGYKSKRKTQRGIHSQLSTPHSAKKKSSRKKRKRNDSSNDKKKKWRKPDATAQQAEDTDAIATLVSLAASATAGQDGSGNISDLHAAATSFRRGRRATEEHETKHDCCPSCWTDLSTVPAVRTLRCGHSLCAPCLNAWARRREQEEGSRPSRSMAGGRSVSISCPVCRDRSRFIFAS